MQYFEEVYTSAPELIEGAGAGSLGVVAKYRDLPRDVESDLKDHRAYTILDQISIEDVAAHPVKHLISRVGRQTKFVCITQTVFAGADHTGRVTPLAHHIFLNHGAMKDWALPTILRRASEVFVREWRRGPGWLDGKTIDEIPRAKPIAAWMNFSSFDPRALVSSIVQVLSDFEQTKRPAILLIPMEQSARVPELLAELLELLPLTKQSEIGVATHVVEISDAPRDAGLLVTYPGTPFHKQHEGRRDATAPHFFDISRPHVTVDGAYAQVIYDALKQQDATKALENVVGEWNAISQLRLPADGLAELMRLKDSLAKVKTAADANAAGREIERLSKSPAIAQQIERWTNKLIKSGLSSATDGSLLDVLAAIRLDGRWPISSRNGASERLIANAEQALPVLARQATSKSALQAIESDLARIAKLQPEAIKLLLNSAEQGDEDSARLAAIMMRSIDEDLFAKIEEWNNQTMTAPSAIRQIVLDGIRAKLEGRTYSANELTEISNLGMHDDMAENLFLQEVYLRLALAQIGKMQGHDFNMASTNLMAVAARIEKHYETAESVFKRNSSKVTSELTSEWIEETRRLFGNSIAERLVNGLRRTSLAHLLDRTPQMRPSFSPAEHANVDWSEPPANRHGRQPNRGGGLLTFIFFMSVVFCVLHFCAGVFLLLPQGKIFAAPWQLCLTIAAFTLPALFILGFILRRMAFRNNINAIQRMSVATFILQLLGFLAGGAVVISILIGQSFVPRHKEPDATTESSTNSKAGSAKSPASEPTNNKPADGGAL